VIKAILLIITGVFALIAQSVYFLKDDRTANTDPHDRPLKTRWHIAGGLIHVWMYYVIADNYGVQWGLWMATLTWSLFDGFINSAINREFFFVGTTSLIDKGQQWAAKRIGMNVNLLSAILKLVLTLFTLYFTISYYGRL
jgi:hypothetical protein